MSHEPDETGRPGAAGHAGQPVRDDQDGRSDRAPGKTSDGARCDNLAPGAARDDTRQQEHAPETRSDETWREKLTPEQFDVCRMKGTEAPFTGKYWKTKEPGVYACACCGAELFSSETKYDSGSGWPSFYDVAGQGRVALHEDLSHGMRRIEVTCATCDAHLGHLFPDGPRPTGKRYCINSASLDLRRKE